MRVVLLKVEKNLHQQKVSMVVKITVQKGKELQMILQAGRRRGWIKKKRKGKIAHILQI